MQLKNEFLVAAGAAQTWALLTDLERIAPCMPGASLGGREGADYLGNVKVKVGPISAHFHGTARFVEQDDAAYRATIQASGKALCQTRSPVLSELRPHRTIHTAAIPNGTALTKPVPKLLRPNDFTNCGIHSASEVEAPAAPA